MATSIKIAPQFQAKLTAAQQSKVAQVCTALKIANPNWLMAVMYFETGYTFSTSITNSIGSVGLIQFTKDGSGLTYKTIAGKKYYLKDIAKMTFDQQMDLVQLYLKSAIGSKSVNSFTDLYLAVFFPAAIGKSDSTVLQTVSLSAKLIATQNPLFDTNKDGQITKGEVTAFFKKQYESLGIDFDTFIGGVVKSNVTLLLIFAAGFFLSCTNAALILN